MVIAIRIVLSLIALFGLYFYSYWECYNWLFGTYWQLGCVAETIGIFVGIPLAIALVAGYLKKSKPVFWNVFVGTFFVMTIGFLIILWIATL